MTFAYPWLLLLFIPFAFLVIYILKRPRPSIRIPSVRPFLNASAGTGLLRKAGVPFIIYTLAIAMLIFALSRPRKGIEEVKLRSEGIDIVLAIDLSGSMRAIDVPEKINTKDELYAGLKSGTIENRLDTAKKEIAKFIDKRPNDRIGLVGFAPLPYSICPPTLDHAWLIENMKRLQPGIIGENTGIAGPISTAVQRLKDSEAKRRVIVLFTDGSNNVNARITPLQAAKLAANYDIVIYTVGIGSNRAFVIQNVFGSSQLVPLEGEFDEKLLQDMAKVSSGKYYKAADAEGMAKVMNEIDKMEKTSVEQPKIIEYSEFAPGIVTASIFMLLLAFTLENTFFRRLP